ncbi:MAG: hypothetical protein VW397_08620 [Candidatus Margulisiibacteriota bacterium]
MYKIISLKEKIIGKVKLSNLGQQGLNENGWPHGFASVIEFINKGEIIYTIDLKTSHVSNQNHWKAFQVGINEFVIDEVVEGINHDCDPSAYFEPVYNDLNQIASVNLIARRDILPISVRTLDNIHNVITFNYLTNEVSMEANFECKCQTCSTGQPQFLKGMKSLPFLALSILLDRQLPKNRSLWMPQTKALLELKAITIIKRFFKISNYKK